ncbi:MAG TPA: ornithine carbamoyltransferase [Acidimicrobiia bacterium]
MSFLTVSDLGPERVRDLVTLGLEVKRRPERYVSALAGRSIGLFFEKQSLRTWVSCDVAAVQLGAHPLAIRNDQTGMGSRETPEDVGRVLDRYLDLLAMRVFDHGDLEAIDAVVDVPVVNLLSDREHPCQAVADVMTLAENGVMNGTVAYVGDGNNVCHSLMVAVTMCGGSIRVATAPGYEPDPAIVRMAEAHGPVVVTTDPLEAVEGADAVYTDVWASMGQEEEAELRRRHFARYRVDEAMFDRAAPGAIFLHCLPAHRGDEVTHEVLEHERSRVFDQAENRLHSFKAVLLDQLG